MGVCGSAWCATLSLTPPCHACLQVFKPAVEVLKSWETTKGYYIALVVCTTHTHTHTHRHTTHTHTVHTHRRSYLTGIAGHSHAGGQCTLDGCNVLQARHWSLLAALCTKVHKLHLFLQMHLLILLLPHPIRCSALAEEEKAEIRVRILACIPEPLMPVMHTHTHTQTQTHTHLPLNKPLISHSRCRLHCKLHWWWPEWLASMYQMNGQLCCHVYSRYIQLLCHWPHVACSTVHAQLNRHLIGLLVSREFDHPMQSCNHVLC